VIARRPELSTHAITGAVVARVTGTASSHPSSGQTGDLYLDDTAYLDNTARLWFCTATG